MLSSLTRTPVSLDVAIAPKTSRYSVVATSQVFKQNGMEFRLQSGKGFPILFSVRNPSLTTVHVGYWTCSSYENWQSDNKDVAVATFPCFSNGMGDQEIPPGGTFAGEIGIHVADRLIGSRVTFRLGFVPSKATDEVAASQQTLGTFWSNPISVDVVE